MRRFITLLLVLLLAIPTFAAAEVPDLSVMTEAELYQLIDAARLELTKFNPIAAKGTVLYEDECVRITYTGGMSLSNSGTLDIPVIVENMTDKKLLISLRNASCNGWAVDTIGIDVPAGKKAKDTFSIRDADEDAGLTSAVDVQEIECMISYTDMDTHRTVAEVGSVVWLFGE